MEFSIIDYPLCSMSSQIEYFFHEGPNVESIGYCIYWIIKFGPFLLITAVFVRCSFIAYSANMIRFGMDQLHDSLAENSILFAYWFVFTCHIGYFTASTVYKNFDCLHITIGDITCGKYCGNKITSNVCNIGNSSHTYRFPSFYTDNIF